MSKRWNSGHICISFDNLVVKYINIYSLLYHI